MSDSQAHHISARTIGYIGVIAADIAILVNAVLIWNLLGSGSSFAGVSAGLLIAGLHGTWLFSSLRQRIRGAPNGGVKPLALAVLIAASILPVSGIPSGWAGALLVEGGIAQAGVIIMAAFALVVSCVVGAVLGVWFFVVAGNVVAAETTLARDGAQLVTRSVCVGWGLIGWAYSLVGGTLKYYLASFPNVPLLDVTLVSWLALAAAASVIALRIQGKRSRERIWLRDVRDGEWDDYAIESPAAYPDFGKIPPYLTARWGTYSGVLVHEDEDSGAREILGRVE